MRRGLVIGLSGIALGMIFSVAAFLTIGLIDPTLFHRTDKPDVNAQGQTFEQFVDGPHTPAQKAELAQIATDNGNARADAREQGATVIHQFTPDEFSAHIDGWTKAKVRGRFGVPDLVLSPTAWDYESLDIIDPDAGKPLAAIITFSGVGGQDVVDHTTCSQSFKR
jgi:hypothetical protein